MKTNSLLNHLSFAKWLAAVALAGLIVNTAQAHPYASGVTNNAGTISFYLNEGADNVGVSFDNGTATNNLGALLRGLNSFSLGTHTNYSIYVSKVGSGNPALISFDTNRFVNFWGPRGVTVNRSPKTYNFGRTYVVNASGGNQPIGGTNGSPYGTRTVTRGVYVLNPDQTDAVGQGDNALTAGMALGTSTTYSPHKISVGPDDMVYVADGGGLYIGGRTNGVYMVQPDFFSGTNLFPLYSSPQTAGGIDGAPVAFGSYAAGNLVLYAISWDLSPYQNLWRYDVGGGPLPYTAAPTAICNAGISSFQGVYADLAFAPDGKIFTLEYRATPASGSVPIRVFDPTGTPLWNSWDNWGASNGDPYAYNRAIAISDDGKLMVTAVGNTGNFTVTRIVDGIPDPGTFTLVNTGLGGTAYGVAFDAANNVYVVPSNLAVLRVYSLGMTTLAVTGNDWTGTNGTFRLVSPSTTVSVTAGSPTIMEQGPTATTFTITRNNANNDFSSPLPVSFSFSGTATFGADYVTGATNSITIPVGQATASITVTAVDDDIAEPTESIILNLAGGAAYSTTAPRSAEVDILDNEPPQLRIRSISTNIYEGNLNDYARVNFDRWGDITLPFMLDYSSFAMGGTAVSNVDYYLTNLPFFVNYGDVNFSLNLLYPIKHSTAVGSLSILLTNLPGTGYTVSNNTAATTLRLQGVPPEDVVWSDNFENANDQANWNVFFASTNGAPVDDYTVMFYYDYSVAGPYPPILLGPVPPAPHSALGETHGVLLTVNKIDNVAVGAALNLYPIGQSFSNNFALRFDMYLVQNSSSGTTEYSIFGINHSGTKTNWFRNSGNGVGGGWQYDGLWYDVETDGGALGDYVLYTSPTVTNASFVGPTTLASRNATTLTQVFKNPPYTSSAGAPGNLPSTQTPSWAEVEISQVGKVVTLKINNTTILTYTNSTAYTNGNIMLGYEDAYDSIGNGSPQTGEACVIYDNVRVVRLAPPTAVIQPANIVAPINAATNFSVATTTMTAVTNYQWFLGGTAVAGATTSTLNFAPVAKTSFGTYSVRVDDGAYATYSANATLLPPAPVINTQPVGVLAAPGSSPSFSVTATTYSGTTNYQWSYYGTNAGANLLTGKYPARSKTLLLTNVQAVSFGGPYTVSVNDGYTSVTSSPPVTLTFAVSPLLSAPAVVSGSMFRFSFNTELGLNYVLEFKSALTNATWTRRSTNAGTGGAIDLTNSMVGNEGYYRIRMQ